MNTDTRIRRMLYDARIQYAAMETSFKKLQMDGLRELVESVIEKHNSKAPRTNMFFYPVSRRSTEDMNLVRTDILFHVFVKELVLGNLSCIVMDIPYMLEAIKEQGYANFMSGATSLHYLAIEDFYYSDAVMGASDEDKHLLYSIFTRLSQSGKLLMLSDTEILKMRWYPKRLLKLITNTSIEVQL